MRKSLFCLLFALLAVGGAARTRSFSVLQWNIWQEGTQVEGGYEAIVNELVRLRPDFVTLSEVRNYHGRDFIARLCASLSRRGLRYYGFRSDDTGLLSAHPIARFDTVHALRNDHGSVYKLESEIYGRKIALYTAHLDYLNDTYYEVRGYDGNTWREMPPLTDTAEIRRRNNLSMRDEAIADFLAEARRDEARGYIVVLGGDFNEPSVLDWTRRTRHLYDHHGVVMAWPATAALQRAGFSDCYRQAHPNELKHPGFTFPADNPQVEARRLTWAPKSDERDRIDYLFFKGKGLRVERAALFGPAGCIAYGRRVPLGTREDLIEPLGVWPSDHKGLFVIFKLKTP